MCVYRHMCAGRCVFVGVCVCEIACVGVYEIECVSVFSCISLVHGLKLKEVAER